jgi:hypothetical protein
MLGGVVRVKKCPMIPVFEWVEGVPRFSTGDAMLLGSPHPSFFISKV